MQQVSLASEQVQWSTRHPVDSLLLCSLAKVFAQRRNIKDVAKKAPSLMRPRTATSIAPVSMSSPASEQGLDCEHNSSY